MANSVNPGTSCNDVRDFLGSVFNIVDAACSRLTSNDFYCSFRIGVWEADADKFADGSLWPVGVAVRDFVPRPRSN